MRALLLIVCLLATSACSHLIPGTPISESTHGQADAVRVASSKVVTLADSTDPKVVLSLYEDFLCPACARFEQLFGPTVTQLIDSGQVAADYYMVAILDSPRNQNYSSRAGGAAYCVADADTSPDKAAFRRFHAGLFAQQPSETGSQFPTDAELAETARQSGVLASDCIEQGRHTDLSAGLAEAKNVDATPTVRINGEDYELSTPDALAAKVKELLG